MTRFRPCIDLHDGQVKQIVGGTLTDSGAGPQENFVSDRSPSWFAELYRDAELKGGHVIQLGAGNADAAREAMATWPGGMQIGGGINIRNAVEWLEVGASEIIVTSWLFDQDGTFREDRLRELAKEVGFELSPYQRGNWHRMEGSDEPMADINYPGYYSCDIRDFSRVVWRISSSRCRCGRPMSGDRC